MILFRFDSKIKETLSKNVPQVIDQPFDSPDPNLIENIRSIVEWNMVKRKPVNIDGVDLFQLTMLKVLKF